jgi:hypothetical protein
MMRDAKSGTASGRARKIANAWASTTTVTQIFPIWIVCSPTVFGMPTHNGGSGNSEAIMDEAMLKAVQKLKELIGKELTTYPEDTIGINSLIMLLLHFQKRKGWEPKETYRQIELAVGDADAWTAKAQSGRIRKSDGMPRGRP